MDIGNVTHYPNALPKSVMPVNSYVIRYHGNAVEDSVLKFSITPYPHFLGLGPEYLSLRLLKPCPIFFLLDFNCSGSLDLNLDLDLYRGDVLLDTDSGFGSCSCSGSVSLFSPYSSLMS
jgi:hypothetical protein